MLSTNLQSSHLHFKGFPGIPPGADRPQAAVKGVRTTSVSIYFFPPLDDFLPNQAIEVRSVPVQPGKDAKPKDIVAKWVRIELRKVEVLPGGGQVGTFFDYVGQSPSNIWGAPDGEYGPLRPVCLIFLAFLSLLNHDSARFAILYPHP